MLNKDVLPRHVSWHIHATDRKEGRKEGRKEEGYVPGRRDVGCDHVSHTTYLPTRKHANTRMDRSHATCWIQMCACSYIDTARNFSDSNDFEIAMVHSMGFMIYIHMIDRCVCLKSVHGC